MVDISITTIAQLCGRRKAVTLVMTSEASSQLGVASVAVFSVHSMLVTGLQLYLILLEVWNLQLVTKLLLPMPQFMS